MSSKKTVSRKSNGSGNSTSKATSKPKKLKGLGDVIEAFTTKTGIKSIIGDCKGCEQRKEKLNQRFPFYKDAKMNQMHASIYEAHREMAKIALSTGSINTTNQKPLIQLYNDIFQPTPKQKIITCSSCWGRVEEIILQLEQAYLVFKKAK